MASCRSKTGCERTVPEEEHLEHLMTNEHRDPLEDKPFKAAGALTDTVAMKVWGVARPAVRAVRGKLPF